METYEREFGHMIDSKRTISEMADRGKVYRSVVEQPELVAVANGREYGGEIVVGRWEMPVGAFGEQNGSI